LKSDLIAGLGRFGANPCWNSTHAKDLSPNELKKRAKTSFLNQQHRDGFWKHLIYDVSIRKSKMTEAARAAVAK
jgi:hypothetical protein